MSFQDGTGQAARGDRRGRDEARPGRPSAEGTARHERPERPRVGKRAEPATDVPQPTMRDPMSFGPGSEGTLTGVLSRYEREGFTGQFSVAAGACVRCSACGKSVPARDVDLVALHRLEGASDPGDMMAAAALECPCGHRGTITLTYGPLAPPEDGLLLRAFTDLRGASSIPPGQ